MCIYMFHSLNYGARVYLHLRSLLLALKMTQAHQPAPIVNKVRNGKCGSGGVGTGPCLWSKND